MSYKDAKPNQISVPPICSNSNLIPSIKGYISKYSHIGIRAYEFGGMGDKYSVQNGIYKPVYITLH